MQYGSLTAITRQDPMNVAHVAKISIDLAHQVIAEIQRLCDENQKTSPMLNTAPTTNTSEE